MEENINSSRTPKYLKGTSDLSLISEIQSVTHSSVTNPRDSDSLAFWFLMITPWVQKPVWIIQEKSDWNTERRESTPNVTPRSLFHPSSQDYIDLNKYLLISFRGI